MSDSVKYQKWTPSNNNKPAGAQQQQHPTFKRAPVSSSSNDPSSSSSSSGAPRSAMKNEIFKGVPLAMDARSCLNGFKPGYFNEVVQFKEGQIDPINLATEEELKAVEQKQYPVGKVFIEYNANFGSGGRKKWGIMTYTADGKKVAIRAYGPISHVSTRWFPGNQYKWEQKNQFGTYGIDMKKNKCVEIEKASFWYGLSSQAYFGDNIEATNPHFDEFIEWRRRVSIWVFRHAATNKIPNFEPPAESVSNKNGLKGGNNKNQQQGKLPIPPQPVEIPSQLPSDSANALDSYEARNPKPRSEWTDKDWIDCYDYKLNTFFAPQDWRNGQPAVTFKCKAFFPQTQAGSDSKSGANAGKQQKRKAFENYSIPAIADIENKHHVAYNNLRIGLLRVKVENGKPVYYIQQLTDQEKWQGHHLRGPAMLAAAVFEPYLSSGGTGTGFEFQLQSVLRVGDATLSLPWGSGAEAQQVSANEEDPVAKAFMQQSMQDGFTKQQEEEGQDTDNADANGGPAEDPDVEIGGAQYEDD